MRRYASFAASAAVGIALAAVAFGARGGSELSRATYVEVGLLLLGGGLAAAAAARGARGPLHGGLALALFAALAALTAVSVLWSIVPELTWIEANRTLSYLAVFAGAVGAARLRPDGWVVLLRGLLVAAALVVGYALAARVWPGALAENEIYARIGQPFGYWNAVGTTAALALVPAIWLGARRSGDLRLNALAYPLTGVLVVALMLSFSRGALAAALVGLLLWIAIVPLRLRSATVLGVGAAGAAPVVAWALSKDAFTEDLVPLAVRESVAPEFGVALALMLIGLLAAGLAIGFRVAVRAPAAATRRRAGVVAIAAACTLPLAGLVALAASERGIGGTISDRFHQLTSETARTPGGPGRLATTSSSRARYWRQAGSIFEDGPALGTGAGTFGVARLRYRKDQLVARHAHGYVAQTLADLGIAGLAVSLALLAAWLAAALRATALRPVAEARRLLGRAPPAGAGSAAAVDQASPAASDPGFGAERVGLVALALAALVFGMHSVLDWTWFVPGPAVMAIAAAGFVAGRGPLRVASARAAPAGSAPPAATAAELEPAAPVAGTSRARIALAAAVAAVALLCAWTALQPERSDRRSDRAFALLDEGGHAPAERAAEEALDINPLASKPLLVRAAAEDAAGRPLEALRTLESAVGGHRSDPQVWLRLADFALHRLDRPREAIEAVTGALYLDPRSRAAQSTFFRARERLRDLEALDRRPARRHPATSGRVPSASPPQ